MDKGDRMDREGLVWSGVVWSGCVDKVDEPAGKQVCAYSVVVTRNGMCTCASGLSLASCAK